MPAPGTMASKTQQRAFSAPWQSADPSGDGNGSQKSFLMGQKWASPFSKIGTQKEAEMDMQKSSLQYSQGSQQIASKLLQNFQVAPYPSMVSSPDSLGVGSKQSEQFQEKLDALCEKVDNLVKKIDESDKYCAARAHVSQQIVMRRLESQLARQMASQAFLDGVARKVCHYMRRKSRDANDALPERKKQKNDTGVGRDKVTSVNSKMWTSSKHTASPKEQVMPSSIGESRYSNSV
ncbi:hypothetical protein M9435_005387 [Picochlorum sp. BPE23]|nr:hypothetical protein M9435_005387 [Picochlorum sp. BPE23]